jgi:hypothetical protein
MPAGREGRIGAGAVEGPDRELMPRHPEADKADRSRRGPPGIASGNAVSGQADTL